MKAKLVASVAAITALLISSAGGAVLAQSTSGSQTTGQVTDTSNALRVSPVRTDIALDPGASKDLTVYVQNLNTRTVGARALVSDFVASIDESGTPSVILEEDEYAPSHSLKRLAITEPTQVTLAPNERKAITVRITVPKTALPGGYYGAVRYLPVKDVTTGDESGVSISANVGSLILLRVNGPVDEKAELASLNVRQNDKIGSFFKTPDDLTVVARFKNTGNIQVQPFGKVTVKNRSGKIIEEHEINNTDPRGNVLPDSIRRFSVDLSKIGTFGKYTVEGNFGYGTGGELITAKSTFWVVPVSYMIIGGVVLLAIIALAILIPRMLGAYKRRILSGHGRRY